MKIAFVASGHENLGVEYLMAVCAQKGHDVKLYFDPQTFGGGLFFKIDFLREKFDLSDKIVANVIEYRPDIVAFSCMTHDLRLWGAGLINSQSFPRSTPFAAGRMADHALLSTWSTSMKLDDGLGTLANPYTIGRPRV